MKHFSPTLSAKETAGNVSHFIKENKQTFWNVLTPLLPYIIGLEVIDAAVNALYFADSDKELRIGGFVASYFIAALIITWHRVVIDGPDRYVPVNPFKPKKGELAFMGMFVLLTVALIVICAGAIGVAALAGSQVLFFIIMLCLIPGGIYAAYKVSFYFPARAVNTPITLSESARLARGYFWKMLWANLLAAIKLSLLMFLYMAGFMALAFAVGYLFGAGPVSSVLIFALSLPMIIYFQPLLTIIGVTVLSNYYQWAIQNRTAFEKPQTPQ